MCAATCSRAQPRLRLRLECINQAGLANRGTVIAESSGSTHNYVYHLIENGSTAGWAWWERSPEVKRLAMSHLCYRMNSRRLVLEFRLRGSGAKAHSSRGRGDAPE